MLQINCCHKKKNATSSSFSEHNYWLGCFVEKLQRTYSMKFMSLEWMLLKSGKKVRPVLKIPLNGEVKKRVQKTQRRVHVKMGSKMIRDFLIFNHFDTSTPIVRKQPITFESRVKEFKKTVDIFHSRAKIHWISSQMFGVQSHFWSRPVPLHYTQMKRDSVSPTLLHTRCYE